MENQEESIPSQDSVEWSDYVMSLFDSSELVSINDNDKAPNVAGLRRLTKLLLGTIVSSKPTQVWPVVDSSDIRATVVYEVQILKKKDTKDVSVNYLTTYADVADVCSSNTDNFFLSYAIATASTRAEARALRKALGLRCVAAEEVCKKDAAKEVQSENKISPEQISLIDRKCKALDIDVVKFINAGDTKYRSVYDVTKEVASKMIKVLTQDFVKKENIPADIKGYDSNWRI